MTLDEWKDKAEHMQDFYTDAQKEITLLRQVYCDTKLLRKSTPSTVKDAYDSLTCSLQEVEQFDKAE